ncbi:MAG: cupin domain-containing protein [Nostoc sp.]|uniref:cupin domain-containing protein n=1 Tax=Nostoc sp. TaxID=1180 RepID=UPI002FF462A2
MNTNYKFTSIVYPYTAEEFFQNYYEKEYLYIPRNQPDYYDAILNVDDLDLFFQNKNIPISNIRVANQGEKILAYKWTDKDSFIANNNTLFSLFNQGNTLVINAGDRSIPKLMNYCSDLENELKIRLQTNIYITPYNAQGLESHYDTHDVFILQTTGSKIWRLYNTPVELPSRKFLYSPYKDKFELEQPKFEVELKPGDLLYIPRGMVHDASTTNTASVHITLGLYPNYWFELLQELAEFAEEKAEFRKAVPNALMSENSQQEFKQEFHKLVQKLMDNLNVDELRSRKFEQYIDNKLSEDQNRFKDSIQLDKLNLNSVLSRRKNIIFKIDKDQDKVSVKFYGKILDFPLFILLSINTFLQSKPFRVKDINGFLSNEEKIKLATKFIQEGFLKIEYINAEN